jgi:hydroxyacylglutathione hydrolase
MPQAIRVIPIRGSCLFLINYSYVVIDSVSKESVIIDPAWELCRILSCINESGTALKCVLLTHSHIDHVRLSNKIAKKFDCPVFMSKKEVDSTSFRCHGLTPFSGCIDVKIGTMEIIPHNTSGHTSGSVCYGIGNNLFTGDTLFNEGCGMCFGRGANPKDMFDSMQYLKKNISPTTTIYPGHVYESEIGQSFGDLMGMNVYLNIENCDEFVAFRMRKGQKGLFSFK